MSPILLFSILLQIGCAVHVVRTGRPLYWVFILLIGSYIAVAIYLVAEVLPGTGGGRVRPVIRGLHDRIDPERGKRQAARQLELADTGDNRRRLAEQSLAAGDYQQASELYRSALRGIYATDPYLMLGLAKAQFALELPHEARKTLDGLIAANPDFRSSDGHLLYARAVEASGDVAAALHEYEALAPGYPGEEARVRHGLLLKRTGDRDAAAELFRETLKRAETSPPYYRREQREWIAIAERELG
ncbi:tetratricopeptide repeat protein [Luteimonas sp. SJ-92]|uniref:Tetratricopeptide repeat protein n=1 Tax=Luteimonas salinisoli TaxID=2752307 RepID=A0A853JH31_9GAMM|nr:tetratricopeptide repeat protein [Luteimonas salinisoli]NZA28054.1 tetratricopeptide repeat protein [Luteimonas salinisoli]